MCWALKDISIKTKLIFYSVLLVLFTVLIISIGSYKASENVLKKQVGQQVNISTKQIMVRTDDLMKNIHKMSLTLAFDGRLQKLLAKNELIGYDDIKNIFDYYGYIGTFNYLNMGVSSMYIYSIKNMFYISATSARKSFTGEDENYQLIVRYFSEVNKSGSSNYYVWIGNRTKSFGKTAANYISLITPIRDSGGILIGALVIDIPEKKIAGFYIDDFKFTGDFYIEDLKKTIISSTQNEQVGEQSKLSAKQLEQGSNSFTDRIGGKDYLVAMYVSPYSEWRFISVSSFDEMMKENVKSLQNSILIIVFVTVLMLIAMSYFMNQTFYKPVKYFIKQIKTKVRDGKEIEKIARKDEIGFIFNNFSSILDDNNRLMREIYEEKVNSKVYELNALQSQINPHFLYNSLNGAVCMIKIKKDEMAEEMITSLIKLYRLSLDENKKIITVKEELENLEGYISIQKARYGEELKIDTDIEEELLDYKVLKLILQPIVENAIYHGVGKRKGMGNIWVTGRLDEGNIRFVIHDNGKGIPENELTRIREIMNSKQMPNDRFYALQNVNIRIKLYYGEKYGVSIESMADEWTKATVILPAIDCG